MSVQRIRLAVDARMVEHSGIGTFLKNILPRLLAFPGLQATLLGERAALARQTWFDPGRFIPLAAPIYGAREQAELPLRIPVHDVFPLAYFHTLFLAQKAYTKVVLKAAVALADRVVTISEFSAREIRQRVGIREDKLVVIPCGCDRTFAEGAGGPPADWPYLLFVGNVKPHKNIQAALAAFLRLAPRHPDLRLVIVGRKEGFITGDAEVRRLVAADGGGRVVFTGHVSDMDLKAWYKHAQALVFPSLYEGFGLSLLEAMAFGIPVASSNCASLPEVGGDAILYADPEDPAALADCLEDVLEGRWRPDPGKYAERLAGFGWDVSAARYREILEELAREAWLSGTAPEGKQG